MRKFLTASDLKILYLGTPEYSAELLEKLIKQGFSFAGVVTREDKKQGRHALLKMSPVKEKAISYNLPVFTPHSIKKDYQWALKLNFDLILSFSYGQIVPQEFIDLAPLGALNVHGSLLPKYRGAAPIQRAILNGEQEVGYTIMRMVAKMDAGEMFYQDSWGLLSDDYPTTAQKMSARAAKSLGDFLLPFANGERKGIPQDETQVSFANKIEAGEENIILEEGAKKALLRIRAFSSNPTARVFYHGEPLLIYEAELKEGKPQNPFHFHKEGKNLVLDFQDGSLIIKTLQLAGKKKIDGMSFINGHPNLEKEIIISHA